MFSTPPKALVTGATGFIGEELCKQLILKNFKLRTTSRTPYHLSDDHHLLDLTDINYPDSLCKDIDIIFHLAGKAHALAENHQDEAEYAQINSESTKRLLSAAKQAGVQKFVYFSSVKAVADDSFNETDESFQQPPLTAYGKSKLAAEQLVLHGDYIKHPLVIRPSMVYGNCHKGNLPRMIKAIQRGFFPPIPEFNNQRSMIHVEDLVSASILAATQQISAGKIYIVTDGHYYSTRQIYDLIRAELGKSKPAWVIPKSLLFSFAKYGDILSACTGRRFIFDSDALAKLSSSACYSSAKICSELGFSPKYNLQQTLPEIIRFLNLI